MDFTFIIMAKNYFRNNKEAINSMSKAELAIEAFNEGVKAATKIWYEQNQKLIEMNQQLLNNAIK